jgi:hypothetical protein
VSQPRATHLGSAERFRPQLRASEDQSWNSLRER